MAEDAGGRLLGMMKQSLGSSAACTVVRDSGTVACTGAYVLPAARHLGIGALLLGAMVDWAGRHGYQRVALDFEAANIHGSSFWLKHLTPGLLLGLQACRRPHPAAPRRPDRLGRAADLPS